MTGLLTGKVCIIAGAAAPKGIGQATARLFAEHGARLVIADISADASTADRFLATLGDAGPATTEVIAVRCDIADRQDCDRLVAATTNRLRELAATMGCTTYQVDSAAEVRPEWIAGKRRIGVTSGASAPEVLVRDVVAKLKSMGAASVRELDGITENIIFA